MAICGVDEELASKLLVRRSQETDEKLHALAEQLVHDFSRVSDQRLRTRLTYDKLLMTLQDRLGEP